MPGHGANFTLFRARESYFPKKCSELGEILVPEENGLNTIELAIFSLGSTKRLALPGTQRKRGPAEFLHIFQEAKKYLPQNHNFCCLGAPRDTLSHAHSALSQEDPLSEM